VRINASIVRVNDSVHLTLGVQFAGKCDRKSKERGKGRQEEYQQGKKEKEEY